MVPRTLWRAGVLVFACLALGALCGFALSVPEEWLARDPGFSITCPSVQPEGQEGEVITVTPPVEDETLSEGDVTVPWSPSSSPDRKKAACMAVFLCPAIKPRAPPL